jgi:molybdopterin-guanine dinucleotide biosynthesis protein MobB
MPHLLTIVGCKNAGKTRTCELLVPLLRGLGLRIGTLKYTEHDGFDWDEEGKDTFRHREAGSEITGIIGQRVFAYQSHRPEHLRIALDAIIRMFYADVDMVLLEGLRREAGLKLEVYRPGFTDGPVVPPTELLATYGANLFRHDLPHFAYGQEVELAAHIHGNLDRLRTVH